MKINNALNFNFVSTNQSIKSNKQKNEYNTQSANYTNKKIKAEHYIANSLISFRGKNQSSEITNFYFPIYSSDGNIKKLNVIVPNNKEKNLILTLENKHLDCVLDNKKQVDGKKLNLYTSIFQYIYEQEKEIAEEKANNYKQMYEKIKSEYMDYSDIDFSNLSKEEIDLYYPDLKTIKKYYETLKKYSESLKPQNISKYAQNATLGYFKLFKTIGFKDMAFVEKNEELLKKIDIVQDKKATVDCQVDIEMYKASFRYKGEYDIEFMDNVIDVLAVNSSGINAKDIDTTAKVTKEILDIDKENKEIVLDTFIKFTKSYGLADENSKDLFSNLFNPKTQKIDMQGLPIVECLLDRTSKLLYTKALAQKNSIKNCEIAERSIVKEYFDFIRNEETGKIEKDISDKETFIRCRISKYLKI